MSNRIPENRKTVADFNKARARFMARVSAPEISPLALKLAYVIAFKRMVTDTQTLFIGQDELAREIDADERTVKRLLPILQACGLAIERGNGRGNASAYRIEADDERVTPASTFKPKRVTPKSAFRTKRVTSGAAKGGHLTHEKGDTHVTPILRRDSKEGFQGREESDSRPNGLESESVNLDFFGDAKKEGAIEEENNKKNETEGTDAFDRWWLIYPKHVGKLAAKKAFKAALKIEEFETIFAATERYAVEVAGREARHIKNPDGWLRDGRYADEPAQDRQLATQQQQHKHNGHRTNAQIAKEALERCGWLS